MREAIAFAYMRADLPMPAIIERADGPFSGVAIAGKLGCTFARSGFVPESLRGWSLTSLPHNTRNVSAEGFMSGLARFFGRLETRGTSAIDALHAEARKNGLVWGPFDGRAFTECFRDAAFADFLWRSNLFSEAAAWESLERLFFACGPFFWASADAFVWCAPPASIERDGAGQLHCPVCEGSRDRSCYAFCRRRRAAPSPLERATSRPRDRGAPSCSSRGARRPSSSLSAESGVSRATERARVRRSDMRMRTIRLAVLVIAALLFPSRVFARDLWVRPFMSHVDRLSSGRDGRAFVQGRSFAHDRPEVTSYVLGPGDDVSTWRSDQPAPEFAEDARRTLSLDDSGTIEIAGGGEVAALSQDLRRKLGPSARRRALVDDAESGVHVLLSAWRGGVGTIDGWSVIRFDDEHVIDEERVPLPSWDGPWATAAKPLLAASRGVVWIAFDGVVLRLRDGNWTRFIDDDSQASRRQNASDRDIGYVGTIAAYTIGNVVLATTMSIPLSLSTHERLVPTATVSSVGSMFAIVPSLGYAGAAIKGNIFGGLALAIAIATTPLVSVATYGTDELAFNGNGRFWGSIGGAYAGGLAWAGISRMFKWNDDRSLWLGAIGSAIIGTASNVGYLWAGEGFRK